MKTAKIVVLYFVTMGISLSGIYGQQHFTLYDELPCIQSSVKPEFREDFPDWAKMLYTCPVNFFALEKAYQNSEEKKFNTKSAITRYYKIWRKCVQSFVDKNGEIVLPEIINLHQLQKEAQEKSTSNTFSQKGNNDPKWSFLGPKQTFWLNESNDPAAPASCPWQVNVYSIDVASKDNQTIYVGTETGFLNKSTDNGKSWNLLAPHYFFGGGLTAIAIHPEDNQMLYVSSGNQIHKSEDGGNTWMPKLGNERFAADRLRIDKNNPAFLYAASSKGIYVSKDAGETWVKKWSQPTWDIRIHPVQSDIVYAITAVGSFFRLLTSSDGGDTFAPADHFPANIPSSDGAMLAVTPADPDIVMAVLLSSNDTPYLLKGENLSGVWKWNTLATGRTSNLRMDNGQGYFDLVLDISPVQKNIVYVGTTTLYKSTNGGGFFTAVGGYEGNFPIHPDIQDIKMLDNGDVWVTTDGGVNYSTDQFVSLNQYTASVNGLVGSDFWGFDQGWNEDIVVGGRYHNGNTGMADFYGDKALRMGGAESPTGWVLQGKSRHVAFDDLGNGWVLPKKAEGKPEGRFIFSKYPNMDEYGGRRSNLIHHPVYFGTLYVGEGNTLWKSEDSGINWEMLYVFPERVMYFTISHKNPDFMYVDVTGFGIYKSEDGGNTFVHKPASVGPAFGGSFWGGKLHFDLSPGDPNTLYVCQQNGTWSADTGRVLKSTDGGNTWDNITNNVSAYLKSILVQPGADGKDIVYLFTNARNLLGSNVYYRKADDVSWLVMNTEYPAGMYVNIPKIFYRDSKIRVAGNAGVWEHPLMDTVYEPLIQPWVEKKHYECIKDTVFFEDHSMMDHNEAEWKWTVTPAPEFIDNPNKRNPKVVLGKVGSYDILFEVIKNGKRYQRFYPQMVMASSCPSIEDCNNPATIPKEGWKLKYVNSQEVNDPGLAVMSFDGDPSTIWHTRWSTGSDPYPHEIQVDMEDEYVLSAFEYLTRQEGVNGRIKAYELYLSLDGENWEEPVSVGEFKNTSAPQRIQFLSPVRARYMRLLALSEVNGNAWASAAEFSFTGCLASFSSYEDATKVKEMKVFPVPSSGIFIIQVPDWDIQQILTCDAMGRLIKREIQEGNVNEYHIDLHHVPSGVYVITLFTKTGKKYVSRVMKE